MSRTRHTVYLSAARVVGILVQVVSVPLVWDAIGAVGFGTCLFLMALCRWVALIDIGFMDGAQRRMTLEFDAGQHTTAFSTWKTYRATLAFYALAGVAVFLAIGPFIQIEGLVAEGEKTWLFAATGAMFAGQYLFQGVSTFFNARRQFPVLAVMNGTQSLLSGVVALALTLAFKRPEAYLAGFAIGNLSVAAYGFWSVARQSRGVESDFDRSALKDLALFGLKLYPTRIATVTSQSVDRIIVTNALGTEPMAQYGSAARIPEAASEALPLNQTLFPDMTSASAKGSQHFASSVDRLSRVALMVGCGLIFIPCAFASPLLQLWLGDKFVPEMAWVMLAVGLYRALETFYSSLALSMIAHGSPKRVLPFTLYNAVALLALMWPAAAAFGIVGVAVLRVAVHLAQFVPLMVMVRKWIAPEINLRLWLVRALATVGVAAVLAAIAVALWRVPFVDQQPWVALLLAPLFSAAYFVTVDRLGVANVPEGIKKRARWAFLS